MAVLHTAACSCLVALLAQIISFPSSLPLPRESKGPAPLDLYLTESAKRFRKGPSPNQVVGEASGVELPNAGQAAGDHARCRGRDAPTLFLREDDIQGRLTHAATGDPRPH